MCIPVKKSKWQILQEFSEQTERLEQHRKESERLTKLREQAIRDAHNDGFRISEICEATGLARTSVYRALNES